MKFKTDYVYVDRETKARYVWLKYREILKGRILDVGADECHLRSYLDEGTYYLGIGLGGSPDLRVDLEKEKIPFDNSSFDCVLCLDVLEHLENIHEIFDEICRVSKKYVIISLPNPYAVFWMMLRHGCYRPTQALKFYGLPVEKPEERHKWFFSSEEAKQFIVYRSKKNKMKIVQIDIEKWGKPSFIERFCQRILFTRDINTKNLYYGTLWAVLEKKRTDKV